MASIEILTGESIAMHVADLARLRVSVFRDWPYLYDGSEADEREYLAGFAERAGATLVLARDTEGVVGCATCMAMSGADSAMRDPIAARGWETARFCYFGESVLLPAWRGQGIGVRFFVAREARARAMGAEFACFAAVQRAPGDPRRPADAVPLDRFWRRRGFVPYPDLSCVIAWKQVDGADKIDNRLAFWLKPLADAPLP